MTSIDDVALLADAIVKLDDAELRSRIIRFSLEYLASQTWVGEEARGACGSGAFQPRPSRPEAAKVAQEKVSGTHTPPTQALDDFIRAADALRNLVPATDHCLELDVFDRARDRFSLPSREPGEVGPERAATCAGSQTASGNASATHSRSETQAEPASPVSVPSWVPSVTELFMVRSLTEPYEGFEAGWEAVRRLIASRVPAVDVPQLLRNYWCDEPYALMKDDYAGAKFERRMAKALAKQGIKTKGGV